MPKIVYISLLLTSFLSANYYYHEGKKVELESSNSSRSLSNLNSNIKYYRNIQSSQELGVTDKLIISFKDEVNLKEIYSLYNLEFVEKLSKNLYLLKALDGNSIEVSAKLFENKVVNFAHPNFLKDRKKRSTPTDKYFNLQWHLQDIEGVVGANINILNAWKKTKGKGVKIAIFDDGVDSEHEDLKGAVIGSFSVLDNSSDANPSTNNSHGTFIAGLLGARENGIGVVGVAPESSILAIKGATGYGTIEDSKIIKGFNWAKENGADIMSNSWGTYSVSEAVKTVIVDCAINGRDGKGMIILFAHGNNSYSGDNQLAQDESSIEEVLAVGSSNQINEKTYYTNYGSFLDIVAPGGDSDASNLNYFPLISTDLNGYSGYSNSQYSIRVNGKFDESIHKVTINGEVVKINSVNYNGGISTVYYEGDSDNNYITRDTMEFGTSYSTPIVAGVSALILSINPNLTREQVFDILFNSSDKIGNYDYSNGRSFELGYGKVNASNAIEKALATVDLTAIETLSTGWHLLGATEDLKNLKENYNLNTIWSYKDGIWTKDSTLIEKGFGFWIKK